MTNQAIKDADGKVDYSILPPDAIEAVARLISNSKKYPKDNWFLGMSATDINNSIMRHLQAINKGQDLDSESGEHHYTHIIANAMFGLILDKAGRLDKDGLGRYNMYTDTIQIDNYDVRYAT